MLKFSEIFEFSRKNPIEKFERIRMVRMVRMVRSLADRTFQPRLQASNRAFASTQVLFVVDDPDSAALEDLKGLQQWTENQLVRVYVNSENLGASKTRNAGMAQSSADYIICLDDDVIPESQLFDAYISAIRRYPNARAWVSCVLFSFMGSSVDG